MPTLKPKRHQSTTQQLFKAQQKERGKESKRQYDETRGTAAQRGYDSNWRRFRLSYLSQNPLCAECQRHGYVKQANIIDHIVPHKGDTELFWDESNMQPLCQACHNSKTAQGL